MKKYAGFRNGYVRVRIYGEQTERFLICAELVKFESVISEENQN